MADYQKKYSLPVAIVRPTLISSVARDPYPGTTMCMAQGWDGGGQVRVRAIGAACTCVLGAGPVPVWVRLGSQKGV